MFTLTWGVALGQGLVNFHNDFTPPGAAEKAYVRDCRCEPLNPANCQVEILDSTGESIKSGRLVAAGIFSFGVVAIPGSVPGGNASITIRAWDVTTGATYQTATEKVAGVVFLAGLGGGGGPIPTLGMIGDFTGLWFGWECGLCWQAATKINQISAAEDRLIIQAEGNYLTAWTLMSSTNLVDWVPVGETQRLAGEKWFMANFEWEVPMPSVPTLYRVVLDSN